MTPFQATTLLLLTTVAPATSAEDVATARDAPSPPGTPGLTVEHRTNKAHLLGLRADLGSRTEVGIGYLHAHESDTRHGLRDAVWLGYGTDLRMVVNGTGVDAVLGYAVGRVSGFTDAGPCGLELGLGAGSGSGGVHAAGSAGIFVSAYYVEVGYVFQFPMGPFDRPDWLGAHFVGLRAHVPVHRYDRKAWTSPVRRAAAPAEVPASAPAPITARSPERGKS